VSADAHSAWKKTTKKDGNRVNGTCEGDKSSGKGYLSTEQRSKTTKKKRAELAGKKRGERTCANHNNKQQQQQRQKKKELKFEQRKACVTHTHTHTQKDKSTRKKNREEGAVGLRAVGGMEREAKGGWMKDHNTERKRDEVGKQSLRACQLVETKTPRTASRSGRRIREGLCCKVSVPKRGQPKIN
jgi:hypothetical protein